MPNNEQLSTNNYQLIMNALILREKNAPLMFEEIENPLASLGETVVHLKAAALNHRDLWITKGQYGGIIYPMILGSDGAGVTESGEEVIINPSLSWGKNEKFQSADFKILGLPIFGTFAEQVKVPTENIHRKPKHLSFEQASALPLAGLTAYRALVSRCKIQKKDKVLISGIGGGVALFALQFALAKGCDVWVTSSSEEKIQRAVSMGAKGGYNYSVEAWSKQSTKDTGGFDVVIDGAVGTGFSELIKSCAAGARICFYGGTAGAMQNVSPQPIFWKQISILGSTMGSPKEFASMIAFVDKHKIVPVVDEVFALQDGNAALQKMDTAAQFGKLVLSI